MRLLSRPVRGLSAGLPRCFSGPASGYGGSYGNGEQGQVDLGKGERLKFQKGKTDALDSDPEEYLKTIRKDMYPPGQRQKEGSERKDEDEARRKQSETSVSMKRDTKREVGTGDMGKGSSEYGLGGATEKTPDPSSFWRPSGSE
jgi:hypothetical protein